MLRPNQRTLADPRHGLDLAIGLSAAQKLQSVLHLRLGVLPWSALPVVGILSGNRLASLGAFHNHASFVLCECKHHSQNQVAGQGVLNQSHIQNVNPHSPLEQLPDGLI